MANLYPEITRPSCVVKIALRCDEYDDTGALAERLPPLAPGASPIPETVNPDTTIAAPAASVEALQARLARLDAQIQETNPSEEVGTTRDGVTTWRNVRRSLEHQRERLTAQLGGSTTTPPPTDPLDSLSGPSPDERVIPVQFIPKSISLERNGVRTADTCTITCDFRDLPIPAQIVRGAAVMVTLGLVDPADYTRGIAGERRAAVDGQSQGALFSYVTEDAPNATHFIGCVDRWRTKLSAEGDTVEIECRDITGILLDTPVATGTAIDLSLPLDQGIQAFLRQYPALIGINVVFASQNGTGPGAAPVPARAAPQSTAPRQRTRRRSGSTGTTGQSQHRSGNANMNLWDAVTDVCDRCGFVPIFDDYTLRIIDPRTFWSNRDVAVREVYGQTLKDFAVERHIGGVRVPTIEVRSYDADIGRVRWARYPVPSGASATQSAGIMGINPPPQTPARANDPGVSGHNPQESIRTIVLDYGINDSDTLRRIARSTFEQMGRQELEGNLTTDFATSYGPAGAVDQADMLHLKSGDAIEVLVAGAPGVPAEQVRGLSAAQLTQMDEDRRASYLVGIGWDAGVARRFARLSTPIALQTTFRVSQVQLDWDSEEGLQIAVDFINFIVVREEGQTVQDNGTPPDVPEIPNFWEEGSPEASLLAVASERSVIDQQRSDGLITQQEFESRSLALDQRAELAQTES